MSDPSCGHHADAREWLSFFHGCSVVSNQAALRGDTTAPDLHESRTSTTLPSSDDDLFATDTLLDPYPVYARLRDAGPVVRLSRFDAWALPRYEQVSTALRDHETFSSASGVGFAAELNEIMAGGVLASDPPHHTTLRGILSRMLMPRALRDLGPSVTATAEEIVDRLATGTEFDAVSDLAEVFTPRFVADLIGLPEEGRDRII
ncbi:hypothetical protein [Streptomyces sp. NPDC001537]